MRARLRILRGLNLLAALAAQSADETTDRVLLPARRFDDLGQARALCAFHQRDDFRLLVRNSVAPVCARARGIAWGGDFFDRVLSVATDID